MKRALLPGILLLAACAQSPAVTTTGVPSTTTGPPSTTTVPSPSTGPTTSAVRVQPVAASVDLDGFLAQLEMTHPDPFHGVPRIEFVAALEELRAGIEEIAPASALVETMRVTAMLSREGRDGHQFAIPHEQAEGRVLPFRIYEFDDGVFITASDGPDLKGARLVSIASHAIEDVLALVEPLVPRDGPATVPSFRPFFTLRTDVLAGLGLIVPGSVAVGVEMNGAVTDVTVDPIPFPDFQAWGGQGAFTFLPDTNTLRYRAPTQDHFWMEDLPGGVLYVRYSAVAPVGAGEVEELSQRAALSEKTALDLRHNPGGDNNTYVTLLEALQSDSVDRAGRFFVLTDRVTFSAASNLATELEQSTEAVFVGEAMGGGLNFWNDVAFYPMPHLPVPMRIGISTRYWEKSTPDDPRLTIEPDIALPVLSADYFAGRDPLLEAVQQAG